MKTILTILFLCSVAVSQQAAVPQSSKHVDPAWPIAQKNSAGHWELVNGHTLDDLMVTLFRQQAELYDKLDECQAKKKARAGAHSETSGKPDSEKLEKKLP